VRGILDGHIGSQTEARTLLEIAQHMSVAKENMDDLDEYRAALRLNWRLYLWMCTTFDYLYLCTVQVGKVCSSR
jgi:hypothetical protein